MGLRSVIDLLRKILARRSHANILRIQKSDLRKKCNLSKLFLLKIFTV